MPQNYEILPGNDLGKLLSDPQKQFLFQDKATMARIYRLPDDQYILFPAVGKMGLKFKNKISLDSVIESGTIPINDENLNPFQLNQSKIKTLENEPTIDEIIGLLESSLHIGLGPNPYSDSAIVRIDEQIDKISISPSDIYFNLGIYIGEYIKRGNADARWKIIKRYKYNPYFEPYLVCNGYNYNPWYKLDNWLSKKNKIKLSAYVDSVRKFKVKYLEGNGSPSSL